MGVWGFAWECGSVGVGLHCHHSPKFRTQVWAKEFIALMRNPKRYYKLHDGSWNFDILNDMLFSFWLISPIKADHPKKSNLKEIGIHYHCTCPQFMVSALMYLHAAQYATYNGCTHNARKKLSLSLLHSTTTTASMCWRSRLALMATRYQRGSRRRLQASAKHQQGLHFLSGVTVFSSTRCQVAAARAARYAAMQRGQPESVFAATLKTRLQHSDY